MAGSSRFIARIAIEGMVNPGVDIPIQLESTVRQMAFKGEITDQRLKRVLSLHDGLTLAAVKIILGKGFLESGQIYKVDTSISSRFLASMLDAGVPKAEARVIMSKLFKADLLGGLEKIISAVFSEVGVPRPKDIPLLQDPSEVVKIFPFILDMKGMVLLEHKERVEKAVSFLKKVLQMEAVNGHFEWVQLFQAFTHELNFM